MEIILRPSKVRVLKLRLSQMEGSWRFYYIKWLLLNNPVTECSIRLTDCSIRVYRSCFNDSY